MTQSQKRALDAVQNMIEVKTDEVFAHNIMILIFGILNVEYDMDKDTTIPISPNWDNDKLQVPDWLKTMPTPPFVPRDISHPDPCPFPGEISHPEPAPWEQRVWYNNEPEPIQTNKQEDVRYVTEITCTGDKNGIVCTTNTADVQYNGDFREEQTSFNDK
jgi:hypothetical protein